MAVINFSNLAVEEPASNIRVLETPKDVKLKKDGTAKRICSNKQKGRKSEVYALSVDDMRNITSQFAGKSMWQHYLIFIMSCNMARRVGDTLNLTWEHIYNPATGKIRSELMEIVEEKTDKLANPRINSAVRNAVERYIQETHCNPSLNGYKELIFIQTSGNYRGKPLSYDGYRKGLKKVAAEVGIEYNVGTHSPRKTFGMISRMIHPGDYDSMELLQTIFNHSDVKTTKHYIGLTKQKIDKYYDDMGEFFDEYVIGGKTYQEVAETPIVSLDTGDLRDIIKAAYQAGAANAGVVDPVIHIDAINGIMSMIEGLAK